MADVKLPPHRTLRGRLSLVVAAVILLAVMTNAAFVSWRGFEREIDTRRELSAGVASAYAASVADPVSNNNRNGTLAALKGIRDLPGIVQADIRLSSGELFAQMGSGVFLVRERGDLTEMTYRDIWNTRQLRIEIPVVKNGAQIATLSLLADVSDLYAAVFADLRTTLLAALIAASAGILLARRIISYLTRPLHQLSIVMAAFGDDQGANLPEIHAGRDETGLLADAFNDMIASIRERDARITAHLENLEETVDQRTYDLREARNAAEAANQAKSDFLATMSHEIRTPMNGMLVMAEMLSSAKLSSRHRRYADIIARSGKSLMAIINDILDLSKVEAGKLELEAVPVSPETLIVDAASLFWERTREKDLQLATFVSPDVPELIIADPTRLGQILTNLVNNALKFTDAGGVTIRVGAAPSNDPKTVHLSISVEDTGVGIPADKIDRIFEAFSQADQTTTRRFGGTGLGLTVCKRLSDAMGGDISVTSDVDRGSVFTFTLDVAVEAAAPQRPSYACRVMLALQDGPIKETVAQTLQLAGCDLVSGDADMVIGTSDRLRSGAASSAPYVILSDVGDMYADDALRSGEAQDRITLPLARRDLDALLNRASSGHFRGATALEPSGDQKALRTFDGLKILAADDNAINREVLREALSELNVQADFAENGEEAVRLAGTGQYQAILMDGSMPIMDGFSATRAIRAEEVRRQTDRVPIFALTAQIVGTSAEAWLEAGADGYMTKPFTLDQLSDAFVSLDTHSHNPTNIPPASQVPASDDAALLDPDTIANMAALGQRSGRDVRTRIWSMFKARLPESLAILSSLINEGAPAEDIARQAHALKSMSLSAGAKQLAVLCEPLEELTEAPCSHQDMMTKLHELEKCTLITREAMDVFLPATAQVASRQN